MCRATLGASAVTRLTSAASAIFSYGSRGVPGVVNTLKRVPELPNAHEGSSMAWPSRVCRMSGERVRHDGSLSSSVADEVLAGGGELVFEVEDLGEGGGGLVGAAVEADEEPAHLGFPSGGDGGCREVGLRGVVVVGLVVADETAALAEEQRVVAPAGGGDLGEHLGPHRRVAREVLVEQLGLDLELEADAAHGSLVSRPRRRGGSGE